jgi:hypothetical protein
MLNCGIFQLPIDITRQLVFANKINVEGFENNRIRLEFITKTDETRLFVLGRNTSNEIVVVFRKDGNNDLYVFEKEYWLLDGTGSMDAQIPNYQFWERAVLMKIFSKSL